MALTALVEVGLLPRVADLAVQSEFSHYFIAGMALFLARDRAFDWQIAQVLTLCAGNAVYRALGYADAVGRRYAVTFDHVVITAVVIALFAVMILVALGVTRPLGGPWLAGAGALTYPLYLLHAHIGVIGSTKSTRCGTVDQACADGRYGRRFS